MITSSTMWYPPSIRYNFRGLPSKRKVTPRAVATKQSDDTFVLEAAGKIMFKPADQKRSIPVRLDATGTATLD